MSKEIVLDAILDLDLPLAIVARYGVLLANRVTIRLVAKYQGITILCDTQADMAEFAEDALRQHAKARYATDDEAMASATRLSQRPGTSLEKLDD